ncbi:sodium channel modifier 1-like isoform X2 [Anneissia japonica]|nr:sodium channel modifier 1-like isoform X2 [Anneissia japonica]
MLTIHRRGKKHEKCLESHYRKKWTYMALVEKRHQENYVRNKLQSSSDQHQEDLSPLLTKTHEKTQNVLLKATPYNSCVKWSRHTNLTSNVGQQTVPSTDSFLASSQNEHVKAKTIAEGDDHLTTPKLQKMSLLERQLPSVEQSRAFKHYMPSKVSHRRIDSGAPVELKPYTSKLKRNTCVDSLKKYTTSNADVCVPVTEFETCNKYQQDLYPSIIPNDSKLPGFNDSKMPGFNLQLPIRTDFKNSNSSERHSVLIYNDSESKGDLNSAIVHKLDHKSASKKKVVTPVTGLKDEDKKKKVQQILQLTSSGWKRDRGGIWIKDEDVEFDSDEEEPPLTL